MSFLETIERARAFLERNERVSLRVLQREFELDSEGLDVLIEELVDIQRVAIRDGGALALAAGSKPSGEVTAAGATSEPVRAPRDYTPKHLADKILQSKSALEGERKQVTVLFADVKGSMELAGQLDPEEWHRILDRFFSILSDGVHRFEGTVNQYTGDGIMALFGAPIAHEDHAQRACYAALQLRDEISRYATELKREHGVGFQTRMGLHSGEVVVGKIGNDLRMDYTAQGQSVGLAQRMESLAEPNTCYLTAATAALAGGYFELEDLGEFRVKGVEEPVHVHRLVGLGASSTRFDISRARGLSRFVGRAADLRTLEDALEHSAAGSGQVVGVVAQAGTGKSRLCFEFLEKCRARGMKVFEGRAVAHGKNIPFLPILEVFRAYFGIVPQDDDQTAREKIAGRLVVLDDSFAEALPLLFDFLGVPDAQRPAPPLDPDSRQRQILAVMRQVIQSVSQSQPTITLIEDLHWLDAASADFLEHMVDAQSGSRRLLLVNFRPEFHADWMQKSWYKQIPLTPLGEEAIAELLGDLLGGDPSVAALAAPIHARTGGNPFFTEEIAQTLIESGHLEGERGAYRLVTPVEKLEVPATVQAVLAARIDRLAEREKHLLQVASVIGKDFSEPLLAVVADLPAQDLKTALSDLRRGEFIHELTIYPVVEYSFKHPLTQEVALGSLLSGRRRAVHAGVARAIEKQHEGHLEEHAALLAHHYEEGGEALAAARWHRRAADWVGTTDVEAAMYHFSQVRALLPELPEDDEAAALGLRACTELLNMSWRVGIEPEESLALRDEGQRLATRLGDSQAHAKLAMIYGRARCAEGDVQAYVDASFEFQRVTVDLDHVPSQANAWMYLGDSLGFATRLPEALQFNEEGLERFPRLIPREEWMIGVAPHSVYALWRAYCLAWMGRLDEAVEQIDYGWRAAKADDLPEMVAYCHSFATEVHFLRGDADPTLSHALQVEELCRRLGNHSVMNAHANRSVAYAHLAAGRPADAIEPAREALEIFSQTEKPHAAMAAYLLAEALLETGDLEAAESAADDAISRAAQSLRGNFEALAHSVLARLRLRRDGSAATELAAASLVVANDLLEKTSATTLRPFLQQNQAELAGVLGESAERARLLREAQSGFEAIGAPLRAGRAGE